MPLTFNPTADFAEVTDGLEAVTLTQRDGTQSAVSSALRRRVSEQEAAASDGRYTRSDVKWHVPSSEIAMPPEIGAAVTDGDGGVWTILHIECDEITAKYRLWTRKLGLNLSLTDRITIQRAAWSKDDHGAPPAWSNVRTDLPARVQLVEEKIETEHNERVVRATHRVYLAEPVDVDETHRILRAATGEVFHVVGVENVERIDALFTVNVVKTPWLLEESS